MRALTDPLPEVDPVAEVAAWAASGAMALTGRVDGPPLGPPAGFVTRAEAVARGVEAAAGALGADLVVDPLPWLGERAAIAGLHRRGATSVGGATRLLRASDGAWMAVSLARPDDMQLIPAWLEVDVPGDPWATVEATVSERPADSVVARARLLGLPASVLGESSEPGRGPVLVTPCGTAPARHSLSGVTVVELASLWAGPLCGSLLLAAGATVTKVESTSRPDGARRGPPAFFALLNTGKRSVTVDLSTEVGVARLAELVATADVVVEGSRPRALEQLGIDAHAVVTGGGPRAWLSITGHGRTADARDWVAFGDDAAVAGGLVAHDEHGPVFCGDAIADPLAGVVSAGAVLDALAAPERRVIDVSLSAVAAAFAGPTRPVPAGVEAAPPRARQVNEGSGR